MKIARFKILHSTNAYLQNLLEEGHDVIDNIVVADFQTSGKGQGRNVWESEDGKNLLFSVALDMSFLKAEDQFVLTQMVSVAMIEVLKKFLPEEKLFIKWPNDIYFQDKKLAGILIKNEIKGMMMGTSIIGIGLNVNQTVFDERLPNPISMKMITGKDYDLNEILEPMVNGLRSTDYGLRSTDYGLRSTDYGQRTTVNGQRIAGNDSEIFNCTLSIVNSYTSYLYRYKQWALYEHEGTVKEMMITAYDKFGRLILKEKNDREVVCDLKEIVFLV